MLSNAARIISVSSFLAWLGWNVLRNLKINSMFVLICYAKLLGSIVNNGIYAIWDVWLSATALTCSLLDKYCFCVFFYFLLFVCLHISSFFLPKWWNKDVYIAWEVYPNFDFNRRKLSSFISSNHELLCKCIIFKGPNYSSAVCCIQSRLVQPFSGESPTKI